MGYAMVKIRDRHTHTANSCIQSPNIELKITISKSAAEFHFCKLKTDIFIKQISTFFKDTYISKDTY